VFLAILTINGVKIFVFVITPIIQEQFLNYAVCHKDSIRRTEAVDLGYNTKKKREDKSVLACRLISNIKFVFWKSLRHHFSHCVGRGAQGVTT
jgi:hypothetical protein